MFKLIEAPKKKYAEAFQSMHTKFSFVKRDGDTLTEMFAPTICKDFLGDVLWAEQEKKPVTVWGFTYDGTKENIDRDKCRLLVRFPSPREEKNFFQNFDILVDLEGNNKIGFSSLHAIAGMEKALYVESDPWWLGKVWRISLLGYLMKCMCYEFKDKSKWYEQLPPDSNEGNYMAKGPEKFKAILSNLREHANNMPNDVRHTNLTKDYEIHHQMGVFASVGIIIGN